MSRIVVFLCSVVTLVGLTILFAPNIAAKKNPVSAPSGRDIYMDRCGACHGEDGKGNGPAVGALKVAPADLTSLAKRNGGKFPAEHVKKMVSEWVDIGAHGSREMPIWGDLFLPKSPAAQEIANERFKQLVAYLVSIQE
ncbi:MAG: cytochrome c [Acidobacteriia bacterium]|nr:cytochrome c [Terriglobia bacterium]